MEISFGCLYPESVSCILIKFTYAKQSGNPVEHAGIKYSMRFDLSSRHQYLQLRTPRTQYTKMCLIKGYEI